MSATICVQDAVARPALPHVGIEGFRSFTIGAWNRTRRAVAVRRYRRTLERMPNCALRDIGIARDDIARVIDENLDPAGHPLGIYPF